MTCLLAYKSKSGSLHMAADSYCGDSFISDTCQDSKLLEIGPLLLGVAGGIRAERAITKAIKDITRTRKKITAAYLKDQFSLDLIKHLHGKGILKEEKGVISLEESEYLLGHSSGLYYLDSDLAVWQPRAPYLAAGVGRVYAMSVLAYAHKNGDLEKNPEKTLEQVLYSVSQHCSEVRPPFTYITK
jgi:hypothetical protein